MTDAKAARTDEYHDFVAGFSCIEDDPFLEFRQEPLARYTAGWAKDHLDKHLSSIQRSGSDMMVQIHQMTESLDNMWGVIHARALERFGKKVVGSLVNVGFGSYGRGEYYLGSDYDAYLIADEAEECEDVIHFIHHVTETAFGKGAGLVPRPEQVDWSGKNHFGRQIATTFLDARFVKDNMGHDAWAKWEDWRVSVFKSLKEKWEPFSRAQYEEWLKRYQTRLSSDPTIPDSEDIKDGRGGLRDFHAIRWVGTAKAIADALEPETWARYPYLPLDCARVALLRSKSMSAADWEEFTKAYYFILAVRAALGKLGLKPPRMMEGHQLTVMRETNGQVDGRGIDENTSLDDFLEEYRRSRTSLRRIAEETFARIGEGQKW